MSLQKTPVSINFSQGVNTKVDAKQLQFGAFSNLNNSVFHKSGLLQKRNGFTALTPLPSANYIALSTLNNSLVAVGQSLSAYSLSNDTWSIQGNYQPGQLSVLPLVRSTTNQTYCDAVVSSTGAICTVFIDVQPSGSTYKYQISDDSTGQIIIKPQLIVATSGSINSSPRVFLLGNNFIIAFGTSTNHIQYIAISSLNPSVPTAAVDLASAYTAGANVTWDAVVYSNTFFIAYNSTTSSQSIYIKYMSINLSQSAPIVFTGEKATSISLCVDIGFSATNPTIYVVYANNSGASIRYFAISQSLVVIKSPTSVDSVSNGITNITCVASSGILQTFSELVSQYPAPDNIVTNIIFQTTTNGVTGAFISDGYVANSAGLGSKAFQVTSQGKQNTYFIAVFGSVQQPSYFLMRADGTVYGRFAYSNGGGYLPAGLPSVTVTGTTAQVPYLIKDLIASINKTTPTPSTTGISAASTSAVYSQTGINLATFNFAPSTITTAEIANNLVISGFQPWTYDGVSFTEQGFNVFPDDIVLATSTTGGNMTADTYYYQVTYEWADNNGNVQRSAPSIPISITTTGSTSLVTLTIPTLKLTAKTNVKIVIYRWSVGQQTYYSVMSPSATPLINDPTVLATAYTDSVANSTILGNPILYTTGGVIENIQAPATNLISLFNNRLFLVDSEDQNLLWFSKQVIEAVPVDMSDLLTIYCAPTTGAQGSTGPITAIGPLDDKLIVFKKDAIYYINGIGPDNTGSNSQYSDATFVSSVVGCSNQNSIVFTPSGLIFQSDKGLWLLGRDLSTQYIGAPVESYTQSSLVVSAIAIPGTNQIRFTMDSGITIMYDYYFQQWGTFTNIPAISSTLYQGLHTYINSSGAVMQETSGVYTDNSNPTLMSFTTGWVNLAGLQGYERVYFMYLLGQYITPFTLKLSIAYDYDENNTQVIEIAPNNLSSVFGSDSIFGGNGTPFGGTSQVFNARIFPQIQKCGSFRISIEEMFDPSQGYPAGSGFTLSGVSAIVGAKKGYRTQSSNKSYG